MERLLESFKAGYAHRNGFLVASTLLPIAPATDRILLYRIRDSTNEHAATTDFRHKLVWNCKLDYDRKEADAWLDLYVAFYTAICTIVDAHEATNSSRSARERGTAQADKAQAHAAKRWSDVYKEWVGVANKLHQGYSSRGFPAWTVPCLLVVGRHLRLFAVRADEEAKRAPSGQFDRSEEANPTSEDIADRLSENKNLEDCARNLNRFFSLCISDRATPIENNRKWATYAVANLLFKTYFRLNSISLTKNVFRTLQVQSSTPDFPPLQAVRKSQQVTYHYYQGVSAFLEEEYTKADEALTRAWRLLPRPDVTKLSNLPTTKNRNLILTYLIPVRLLTKGKVPSPALLSSSPQLQRLFGPIVKAIKQASLHGFDEALMEGEPEFVKRRIYLTLERAREICLRNLFRKVFLAARSEWEGKDGARKIKIDDFIAGFRVSMGSPDSESEEDERDEVELMIANVIYKGLMKGSIFREARVVALSKVAVFPGTGV